MLDPWDLETVVPDGALMVLVGGWVSVCVCVASEYVEVFGVSALVVRIAVTACCEDL